MNNAPRHPILSQPKSAAEPTPYMHSHVVRVFQRDSEYWIVPVARGEGGRAFDRVHLTFKFPAVPLTLNFARLNARELELTDSRAVISRLNERYPILRLFYAEDVSYAERQPS